jgi:hypothetical protein
MSAIVVIPIFVLASEIVSGVLIGIALLCCWAYWKRICILKHDPNSISAIKSWIADNNSHERRFGLLLGTIQLHNTEDLKECVKNPTYWLRNEINAEGQRSCFFEVCNHTINGDTNRHILFSNTNTRPLTLKIETIEALPKIKVLKEAPVISGPPSFLFRVATTFVGILIAAIGALSVLYTIGIRVNGYSY